MGAASMLIAAAAYSLLYAAAPSRRALRAASPGRTRALFWTGGMGLAVAGWLSAAAWGTATGLCVVVAVATATGSVLLLAAPLGAVPAAAADRRAADSGRRGDRDEA